MSFSKRVGLSFNESMSGTMVEGLDDPATAALQSAGRPANFRFSVLVDISSLREFLDAPSHVAALTRGSVSWDGVCRPNTPIVSGGTIQMYRDVTGDGTTKDFQFLFGFRGDDGSWYTFVGEKLLHDDGDFDAFHDLSVVFARIQKDGKTVAAGVTSVHIDEVIDQLLSMNVRDAASGAEAHEARVAFFSFMNDHLRQVYPGLPLLFRDDEQRYLTPSEWRALALIAQAMLPFPLPRGGPTLDDTVANVQHFVRHSTLDALDELRQLLGVLGTFAPLVSGLVPLLRAWLDANVATLNPEQLNLLDQLKQVAVVAYYAHPKADALVGYVRPTFTPTRRTRLATTSTPPARDFDVVIIGAGVAGTLLAQRATARGKSVLLLEAGAYQAEEALSTDELAMTARLYKSSGLQATVEGTPVLQASCVGGGGVVNNAICFQLPDTRLQEWVTAGFPITPAAFRGAYVTVANELGIKPVSAATQAVNPASEFLQQLGPVQKPRVDAPPPVGVSECLVNIEAGCEGTGLCNTGCGNERKRNGFQVYLPQALATGKCTVVPEAKVVDLRLQPTGGAKFRVEAIQVEVRGEKLEVRGREYVLAAGAIASSALLLGSDVHRKLPGLPIGKRFTANVGCPTFVLAKERLAPKPFLQISHAYLPASAQGFIIESWFAPPGTVALAMPGYLDTHAARVRRYAEAVVLAPLVGLEPRGTVTVNALGKVAVSLPIGGEDLQRLVTGSATVARAALQAPKTDVVVLGTRQGHEARSVADVDAFARSISSPGQLRLGTGHPQGGNAMGGDPSSSVVGEDFRVHGVENLRVCDASVFPSVAGVNPQWTVLALAELCGSTL
jgi:choline dehydrogenase-like flavoprotein